jgi:hypothetical protein
VTHKYIVGAGIANERAGKYVRPLSFGVRNPAVHCATGKARRMQRRLTLLERVRVVAHCRYALAPCAAARRLGLFRAC